MTTLERVLPPEIFREVIAIYDHVVMEIESNRNEFGTVAIEPNGLWFVYEISSYDSAYARREMKIVPLNALMNITAPNDPTTFRVKKQTLRGYRITLSLKSAISIDSTYTVTLYSQVPDLLVVSILSVAATTVLNSEKKPAEDLTALFDQGTDPIEKRSYEAQNTVIAVLQEEKSQKFFKPYSPTCILLNEGISYLHEILSAPKSSTTKDDKEKIKLMQFIMSKGGYSTKERYDELVKEFNTTFSEKLDSDTEEVNDNISSTFNELATALSMGLVEIESLLETVHEMSRIAIPSLITPVSDGFWNLPAFLVEILSLCTENLGKQVGSNRDSLIFLIKTLLQLTTFYLQLVNGLFEDTSVLSTLPGGISAILHTRSYAIPSLIALTAMRFEKTLSSSVKLDAGSISSLAVNSAGPSEELPLLAERATSLVSPTGSLYSPLIDNAGVGQQPSSNSDTVEFSGESSNYRLVRTLRRAHRDAYTRQLQLALSGNVPLALMEELNELSDGTMHNSKTLKVNNSRVGDLHMGLRDSRVFAQLFLERGLQWDDRGPHLAQSQSDTSFSIGMLNDDNLKDPLAHSTSSGSIEVEALQQAIASEFSSTAALSSSRVLNKLSMANTIADLAQTQDSQRYVDRNSLSHRFVDTQRTSNTQEMLLSKEQKASVLGDTSTFITEHVSRRDLYTSVPLVVSSVVGGYRIRKDKSTGREEIINSTELMLAVPSPFVAVGPSLATTSYMSSYAPNDYSRYSSRPVDVRRAVDSAEAAFAAARSNFLKSKDEAERHRKKAEEFWYRYHNLGESLSELKADFNEQEAHYGKDVVNGPTGSTLDYIPSELALAARMYEGSSVENRQFNPEVNILPPRVSPLSGNIDTNVPLLAHADSSEVNPLVHLSLAEYAKYRFVKGVPLDLIIPLKRDPMSLNRSLQRKRQKQISSSPLIAFSNTGFQVRALGSGNQPASTMSMLEDSHYTRTAYDISGLPFSSKTIQSEWLNDMEVAPLVHPSGSQSADHFAALQTLVSSTYDAATSVLASLVPLMGIAFALSSDDPSEQFQALWGDEVTPRHLPSSSIHAIPQNLGLTSTLSLRSSKGSELMTQRNAFTASVDARFPRRRLPAFMERKEDDGVDDFEGIEFALDRGFESNMWDSKLDDFDVYDPANRDIDDWLLADSGDQSSKKTTSEKGWREKEADLLIHIRSSGRVCDGARLQQLDADLSILNAARQAAIRAAAEARHQWKNGVNESISSSAVRDAALAAFQSSVKEVHGVTTVGFHVPPAVPLFSFAGLLVASIRTLPSNVRSSLVSADAVDICVPWLRERSLHGASQAKHNPFAPISASNTQVSKGFGIVEKTRRPGNYQADLLSPSESVSRGELLSSAAAVSSVLSPTLVPLLSRLVRLLRAATLAKRAFAKIEAAHIVEDFERTRKEDELKYKEYIKELEIWEADQEKKELLRREARQREEEKENDAEEEDVAASKDNTSTSTTNMSQNEPLQQSKKKKWLKRFFPNKKEKFDSLRKPDPSPSISDFDKDLADNAENMPTPVKEPKPEMNSVYVRSLINRLVELPYPDFFESPENIISRPRLDSNPLSVVPEDDLEEIDGDVTEIDEERLVEEVENGQLRVIESEELRLDKTVDRPLVSIPDTSSISSPSPLCVNLVTTGANAPTYIEVSSYKLYRSPDFPLYLYRAARALSSILRLGGANALGSVVALRMAKVLKPYLNTHSVRTYLHSDNQLLILAAIDIEYIWNTLRKVAVGDF